MKKNQSMRQGMHRIWMLVALLLLVATAGAATAQGTRPPRGDRIEPLAPTVVERTIDARGQPHTVVEIFPAADAYIASNEPDLNFGDSSGLLLGYSIGSENYGAERMLMRFSLEDVIPTDATIDSARLVLYLNISNPSADAPMDTIVRRIASPWEEYTMTWNLEPTWGGIRAEGAIGSAPGPYEYDVRRLVTDWVRGNVANYGVEIIGDESVRQRERLFYARESASNLEPRLVVDYTVAPIDSEPPTVTVAPLPEFSAGTFNVSWSGDDSGGSGIAYYDVLYRVPGGEWVIWQYEVTTTSAEFIGQNGVRYEFQARGVDEVGNVEPIGEPEAASTIDATPPTTTVDPLPTIIQDNAFTVSWTGNDGTGSGIRCYDVRYRIGNALWLQWQDCTTNTSALFQAPGDGTYEFEARARDIVGNEERFINRAEARTIVDRDPPFVEARLWLPLIVVEREATR